MFLMHVFVFTICFFITFNLAHSSESIFVVPRTDKIKTFPCTKCHKPSHRGNFIAKGKNPHTAIYFKHMQEVDQCILCHSSAYPDWLTLLDGTKVSYDEIYLLCRQCHGKIGYNWDHGLHGKQVGHWDGSKTRFNCTECHRAHSPKFAPIFSVSEPARPRFGIVKGEHHQ